MPAGPLEGDSHVDRAVPAGSADLDASLGAGAFDQDAKHHRVARRGVETRSLEVVDELLPEFGTGLILIGGIDHDTGKGHYSDAQDHSDKTAVLHDGLPKSMYYLRFSIYDFGQAGFTLYT